MTFYFTFGQAHHHPHTGEPMKDHWIEVTAKGTMAARAKMERNYGRKWSSMYSEETINKNFYPKGCYEKLQA